MKNITRSFLILMAVFTIPFTGNTQEASITVECSTDTIYAGIPFKLRVTLKNHEGNLVPPSLDKLKIIGGPNMSSSFSMVNGEVSRSNGLTYILLAEKPGKYDLGPATTDGGGPLIESDPVVLEIFPSEKGLGKEVDSWKTIGKKESVKEKKPKLKTRKF